MGLLWTGLLGGPVSEELDLRGRSTAAALRRLHFPHGWAALPAGAVWRGFSHVSESLPGLRLTSVT